jgi:hypothetical protein
MLNVTRLAANICLNCRTTTELVHSLWASTGRLPGGCCPLLYKPTEGCIGPRSHRGTASPNSDHSPLREAKRTIFSVWCGRPRTPPALLEDGSPPRFTGRSEPAGKPTSLTMNSSTLTPLQKGILPLLPLDGPPQALEGSP